MRRSHRRDAVIVVIEVEKVLNREWIRTSGRYPACVVAHNHRPTTPQRKGKTREISSTIVTSLVRFCGAHSALIKPVQLLILILGAKKTREKYRDTSFGQPGEPFG